MPKGEEVNYFPSCSESQIASKDDFDELPALTTKEIMKLINIDKKIRKQEKLLKKLQQNTSEVFQDPMTKLFLTNISQQQSKQVLTRELLKLFRPFGVIEQLEVKKKKSQASYGFIHFSDPKSAENAMKSLRGTLLFGKNLVIYYSQDQRKNYDRKTKKCFECGKKGHFSKDCHFRKHQSEGQKSTQSLEKEPKKQEQANKDPKKEQIIVKKEQVEPQMKKTQEQKAQIERIIKEKRPNKRVVRSKPTNLQIRESVTKQGAN